MPVMLGAPFHGEFSSADASGLTEPNSRFALYGASSVSAITLGANDVVIVSEVVVNTGATLTVTLYEGADNVADVGERIVKLSAAANGLNGWSSLLGHYCQAGRYPKVITSGAGQVDVTIRGTIFRTGS